jgi:hypothetical protein
VGQWQHGNEQNWTTAFGQHECPFCFAKFERHLGASIKRDPDHAAMIMFTSALQNCVELRFIDPDDGVSEWTWWVWICLFDNGRKELGSSI